MTVPRADRPRRSPPSIRTSLAALFVSGFAILVTLNSLVLYLALDRHHRNDFDNRLQNASITAQRMYALERSGYENAAAAVRHVIDELSFAEKTMVAFDSAGARIAQSRRIADAPILDDLTPFAATGPINVRLPTGRFRVVRRSLGEGVDLYLGRDLTPILHESAWLRMLFAIGLPIVLVGGGLIGWWGSRIALHPVVAVAWAADRVGTEVAKGADTFTRLPPRPNDDEIATLTTAFNRLIDRLADALRHERESTERERQLLADAAHELRTPVAILQSAAEVAAGTTRTNEEYRLVLDAIARESRTLGALVNDLLLFSRHNAQGARQIAQFVYLDDTVSGCIERVRALPEARGRHISVGELVAAPAHADPALVERAVLALVHNALVHAPDSPVEVSAGVMQTDGRTESWVRVRDWGPGIAAEDQEKIYDRFTQLDSTQPGTGLGLSIVQLIAETVGGRVVLDSRPGDGATFTLLLPSSAS